MCKCFSKLLVMLMISGAAMYSFAEENKSMGDHHIKHSMGDERISLGLPPAMKQHQLSNMRSHLEAIQIIMNLMAEDEYIKASEVAYSRLGMTEEMRKMCSRIKNKDFIALGQAFHLSGDALGEALKTKDTRKSLSALQTTLGYCVQCHATFRQ